MLPHIIITASAGSGKTWRLTVRYLRLLLSGAEPESIVALTFSRKAAGEFFNAILHRLAEAAADDSKAEFLARDVEMPGTGRAEFLAALNHLVSRMHLLTLGTLDSFFVRIARGFPFELGLNGGFTLLDEHQQSLEQDRVYDRVFAPEPIPSAGRAGFMSAFQEATKSKEQVGIRPVLDKFIQLWHGWFLTAPDKRQWGEESVIWPTGSPLRSVGLSRSEAIAVIRRELAGAGLTDFQQGKWDAGLAEAESWSPGTPFPKGLGFLMGKLLPVLGGLRKGAADITVKKIQELRGILADALGDLTGGILAEELKIAMVETHGIYDVVSRYDHYHHELVRRQGRLTFTDVQLILSGSLSPEASGNAAREARALTHAENRQLMDYRLDARYDHWLLDEFQDTSRMQWRILENLCDEAIQDSEGRKSFFAVGDQKQSIYEWRGGAPGLFDDILDHYNRISEVIRKQPLSVSRRSGPAVIGMVNELFAPSEALAEVLPPGTLRTWEWQEHGCADPAIPGTVLVIEVPKKAGRRESAQGNEEFPADPDETEDGDAAVTGEPGWERAAELLRDLRPLAAGLSCAVLCHRNKQAVRLADYLRAATGMRVVCESALSIAEDNPVNSALLGLIRAAWHASDHFSWQQVLMTPLRKVFESREEFRKWSESVTETERSRKWRVPVTLKVQDQIAAGGFHGTLRWWADELRRVLPGLDPFSTGRMEELCGCAREFDTNGSRDADEFLAFARAWRVRGASHDGAVQVMTVHRSKGLTFDVVLMPDLTNALVPMTVETGVKTDSMHMVEWLLKMPRASIADADPVLAEVRQSALAGKWREYLAQLYVMVTRARHANYLFLPEESAKPSDTFNIVKLVRHMLRRTDAGSVEIGGKPCPLLARFGDPDWITPFHGTAGRLPPGQRAILREKAFAAELPDPCSKPPPAGSFPEFLPAQAPAAGKAKPVQLDLFAPTPLDVRRKPVESRRRAPLRPWLPSEADESGSDPVFPRARLEAQETGSMVHRLLSGLKWTDEAGLAAFERQVRDLLPPPVNSAAARALADVRACLASPTLAGIFAPHPSGWEVWRERSFDVTVDGNWISGALDRVLVRRNSHGLALEATVIDFKTEAPRPSAALAAGAHRRQLEIYRTALGKLLGLPVGDIRCFVLFTRIAEMTEISFPSQVP